MADLVKLKTGTISKLGQKDSYGNPVIPLEAGSVYFAVDTTNHKGKIVYDAPKSNGVDRIVMSTDAENADHAVNASNADKASQAAQLINTRKIDGINFNGTADVLRYAVCATAADTAAKTVSISNFNLTTGARISVRFSTTNTAANPTLNVSSSGAKPIFYNGSAITAGYLLADKVWDFVYDADLNSNSGAWVLVGEKDTNTTYGEATSNTAGLMSASDKAKLDGIDPSAITTNAANIKKNADAISAETTRAKAAEKANADTISAEVTRAKKAEEANTQLTNDLKTGLTSGTVRVAKATVADSASSLGKVSTYQTWIPDNGGRRKYLLMYDITDWISAKSNAPTRGFDGYFISRRGSGFVSNNCTGTLSMVASYNGMSGSTPIKSDDSQSLRLRTTSEMYKPVILHNTSTNKYYLALETYGSVRDLVLFGIFQGTFVGKWVQNVGQSFTPGTLPDGYELYSEGYVSIPYERAIADKNGKDITEYLVAAAYADGAFTFTRGNGSKTVLTIPDAVSNTVNSHIANKSNPHGVTKAQVGLGSVANLDQSKAIKSITRSGTTFTATALDGTTSTFTQQDNNTTYSAATASSAGLMSADDKASYDIIKSNYLNGLTTDSANHKLTFTYGLGKVATDRALDFVKLAGDTLDSGAIFSWPDSGNYANGNSGVSFPVDRGGLKWAGQNDGIYLHGVETAANNLDLQLKFTNDDSNGLSIRNSTNTEVIRLGANGNLMASGAGTLDGALTVGGTTTLNGALVANGTATIGQTLMVNGATTHKATVTFANNTPNVVGDDVQFGDFNKVGTLGVQGLTGTTAISLLAKDAAWSPDSDKGTLSYDGSNLILDKRIKVPSAGGTFIFGKTIGNASINITTDITKDSYYPLLAVKNYNNHVWNIGGIGNNVGIYGYYADRTTNGIDYSTVWDLSSGCIMHSGGLQVGGGTRLNNILTVSGATVINNSLTTTGTTTLNNMSNFARTSITSGTVAGMRTSLLLYGETYGDDAANLAKAGQFSYGDPGPQIIFNTVNNLTSGQPLALIYTDNDTISPGVSLSLVSNQSDAWFIAPHIKALSGFTGELTGNASTATQLKTARALQTDLASDSANDFDGSTDCTMGVTGILPVKHGGTGVTTLTTGYALIGNGTSAVQTRPIKNITSVNALGWVSGDTSLINSNTLAYWNGAYADTDSNILYTAVGQLGDIATVSKNGSITKFLRGDGNWAGVAQLVHQEKTIATTDWVESSLTTNGITYPYCYSFDATGVTTDDTIAWLEITSGQQAGDMLISTGTAKISIYTTVKPDAEIGIKAWYIGEGVEGDATLAQYEQLAQKVETTMNGAMLFFAGATSPADTSGRTAWLDTANNRLKFYWDGAWRAVNTYQ